jgi:hypothetical protein
MSLESTELLRADLESSDPLRVSNIKARPTYYTRTAGFSLSPKMADNSH